MNPVIHSTGGRAFHDSVDCPAFQAGQNLWDLDPWDDYAPTRWTKPIREESRHDSICRGLNPCRVCLPDDPRPFRTSFTFGHEPVTSLLDDSGRLYCARCVLVRRGRGLRSRRGWRSYHSVLWPCTSAIVLGLAPREVTA